MPRLERGPEGETEKDAAERLTYYAMLSAIEEGLVNTAEHTVTVLRSSQPLGPMSEEWLREQEHSLKHRPADESAS